MMTDERSLVAGAERTRGLVSLLSHPGTWPRPNALSLAIVCLLVINYIAPFTDLDYTWQVRTGERIVQTGRLRPADAFTYTIAGRSVPDFEWLYEVVLYGLWSTFGYGGLKLLKTLLVSAPLTLLVFRVHRAGIARRGILLALLPAILVVAPAWNLRPMYCTTIGLLLVSGWLHDHCTGRRPLTWWLPVVMLLWANLHPGVITGQGLLAGAIAWEWLNRCFKLNRPLDLAGRRRLTIIGGLGLAATFLSPDPVERLLYPFRPEVAHPIQRIFVEMQPLLRSFARTPTAVLSAYLVALITFITVVSHFRQYRLWEIALLLGLTGLANLAVRSLQDWVLVMLALGVPHAAVLLAQAARYIRRADETDGARSSTFRFAVASVAVQLDRLAKPLFNSTLFRLQPVWPLVAFTVLGALSSIPPFARRMPIQEMAECPHAALDWAEAHGLHGRFFCVPDYGSYVTWRLGDRARCYVDTRGFFFPHELLEDSQFVPQLGPDWRARLERVCEAGTDYFLLETTGARGQLWRTLQPVVPQPLYLDSKAVLLGAEQVQTALARIEARDAALASTTPVSP
jgi:hypothetical protein